MSSPGGHSAKPILPLTIGVTADGVAVTLSHTTVPIKLGVDRSLLDDEVRNPAFSLRNDLMQDSFPMEDSR